MSVMGVDACRGGWVAVVLGDAGPRVVSAPGIAELVAGEPGLQVVAVDIPIGLPPPWPRQADVEARNVLGSRRSSVFMTPLRAALEADTYQQGNAISRQAVGRGFSLQA